ncbi:hypothetical protein [Leifsonia aquatica]|uniref:hypothetical protein n=1 Tax=Leifsonia aquatica TaxID=144185 RepID=UPI0038176E47
MNLESTLVDKLNDCAREMDVEARRHRATTVRTHWQRTAAATRLCAVLVAEGVRGFDSTVGYAWLRAAQDELRKAI